MAYLASSALFFMLSFSRMRTRYVLTVLTLSASSALISVTVVPALIPTFLRGRLRSEEDNWIVRSFALIYRPLLTWARIQRAIALLDLTRTPTGLPN